MESIHLKLIEHKDNPDLCKVYSKYCRLTHHYLYLACLFTIETPKYANHDGACLLGYAYCP